jgi:hypothetical protein
MAAARALSELALKEMGADAPTVAVVMRVATRLAATVNTWPGLRGSEKQAIVLDTLRVVITSEAVRSRMGAEEHATLLAAVDTIVPETLALVVAAGRGEIDLRRPTVGCVGRLAALLCRAVAVAAPLSEEERRALQAAASVAAAVDPSSQSVEAAPAEVQAQVPPQPQVQETAAGAGVGVQTATDSTSESATPATPSVAPPSE